MKRLLILALCVMLASCTDGTKTGNSGTKTGNSGPVDVVFQAVNAPAAASAAARGAAPDPLLTEDAQGSMFEIQMAVISLDDFKLFFESAMCSDFPTSDFEAPVSCPGNHLSVDGPFTADLVSGESTPSLADLTIAFTDYGSANLNLANAGVSLYLTGSFTCAGGYSECIGSHNFSVALESNRNVPFMGDPFTVDEATQRLLFNFEVSDWFGALAITQCIQDGDLGFEMDGSLVIRDSGGNPCNKLEKGVLDAFADSAKLGGTVE